MTSQNPEFPDAHATAPGGMSQKQLVAELVEKHGYEKPEIQAMTWPQMIDAVAQERLAREQESKQQIMAEHDGKPWSVVEEALADAGLDPDDEDTGVFCPHGVHFQDPESCEQCFAPSPVQPAPMFIGMPDTRDFIFDGHAGAGPSGAERWMNCTASLAAAREFLETLSPNQQVQFSGANTAARQGTTAHAAAETEARVILGELSQAEADMTLMELAVMPEDGGEAYDDEMAEYITEYIDLVKSYIDSERTVLIEQRVRAVVPLLNLSGANPWPEDDPRGVYEIAGSADMVVLPSDDEPVLVVGDLKYGDGINVDVDENPQIRIYALGVLSDLADEEGNLPDLERIEYHIIQPRLGGIKTWTESVDDLLTWRDDVLSPALSLALVGPEGSATYKPSELACQWCPARGGCAALAEQRVESAASLFDTVVEAEFADGPGSFPETTSLTDTRLGELLVQITGLIDIHKDLKEEAQRRLHRGGSVPGFQLVSYTPPRKWKEQATEELDIHGLEELWTSKLITPTQALKILKDDDANLALIGDLIDTPDKRPIVAPEGDRRATWTGRPPEQMFPDLADVNEEGA